MDIKHILSALFIIFALSCEAQAQERLTKEQILSLSTEQLSEMPLEQLMQAVETIGVSSVDELFALIMNKNVSSASKKEEDSFTSPLTTSVITQEEMRTFGCLTVEDAFRMIPGAIVTQKTNGVYDIQIRGLNNIPDGNSLIYTENSNVLLMVDGRVIHNYAIGTMIMENMPISIADVDRIEVVRGACSALYGVNAVNGVINIITRRPSDSKSTVRGSVQFGNQGTYVADAAFSKAVNSSVAIGASVNFQHRERSTNGLYSVPNDNYYVVSDESLLSGEYNLVNGSLPSSVTGATKVNGSQLLSLSDFDNLYELTLSNSLNGSYEFTRAVPVEYGKMSKLFRHPEVSRQNVGFNGYVDIKPSPDVTILLSGGYSQSSAMSTTILSAPYSFNVREFKKAYVNADAHVHDLHVQANYYAGPEDYAVGRPGLKVKSRQVFANADYDLYFGNLNIRPGVYFQYMHSEDYKPTYDYGNGEVPMSGFLNDEAELHSFAPSLRLDYSVDGWRFILAGRGDKTNVPDKWNLSYQAVVSYQFNEKNFIRLNYGRGVRSANMLNAMSSYSWARTGMASPSVIEFKGNEDADLVSIDNFEIGYRWRPSSRLLLDAEVFYSMSDNYGAMMSTNAMATTSYDNMYSTMAAIAASASSGDADVESALKYLVANISTSSNSSYANLPYNVRQFGVSLNLDWIISPKVVAKLNANYQQTTIDNYYLYSQSAALGEQFYGGNGIVTNLGSALRDIIYVSQGRSADGSEVATSDLPNENVAVSLASFSHIEEYIDNFNSLSSDRQEALLAALRDSYLNSSNMVYDKAGVYGTPNTVYRNALTLYYALKYGLDYDSNSKTYVFGHSTSSAPQKVNGHKHKSTPSFYGTLGLVIKPIDRLDISASANFLGKRTYVTSSGAEDLGNRVTVSAKVGYKPASGIEVFVNANNLLNNRKQEFVYSDKIGGIYTLGATFNF